MKLSGWGVNAVTRIFENADVRGVTGRLSAIRRYNGRMPGAKRLPLPTLRVADVVETIQAIVLHVEQTRLPQDHWPIHPLDTDGSISPATEQTNVYIGCVGFI